MEVPLLPSILHGVIDEVELGFLQARLSEQGTEGGNVATEGGREGGGEKSERKKVFDSLPKHFRSHTGPSFPPLPVSWDGVRKLCGGGGVDFLLCVFGGEEGGGKIMSSRFTFILITHRAHTHQHPPSPTPTRPRAPRPTGLFSTLIRSNPKGLASFAPKKRENRRSTTVGGGWLESSSLELAARGRSEEEVEGRRKAWARRGRRTRR